MDLKRLLNRFKRDEAQGEHDTVLEAPAGAADSSFFATQFLERAESAHPAVQWARRAVEVGAQPLPRDRAQPLFTPLWVGDRSAAALTPQELVRLSQSLHFVTVPAQREIVCQDEQGEFLLIVLEGTLAVDRVQPWGGRARLAEARAGDVLGEIALLDAGAGFSACTTLTECSLAVLEAQRLDELIRSEPRLGVAVLALLSRRLSSRLRQVGARLSALLSSH